MGSTLELIEITGFLKNDRWPSAGFSDWMASSCQVRVRVRVRVVGNRKPGLKCFSLLLFHVVKFFFKLKLEGQAI